MDVTYVSNIFVDDVVEMIQYFTDVATGDGLAPLLVVVGAVLVTVPLVALGVLTLGAVGSLFTSD